MVDSKQTASLFTSIGSYVIGDNAAVITLQENITFILQSTAFIVSITAGLLTIYFTIKKHCNEKNSNK